MTKKWKVLEMSQGVNGVLHRSVMGPLVNVYIE